MLWLPSQKLLFLNHFFLKPSVTRLLLLRTQTYNKHCSVFQYVSRKTAFHLPLHFRDPEREDRVLSVTSLAT